MTTTGSDTPSRIVDAAFEIVANGKEKFTLDRVATAASVHRATIFRHFPGGRAELLVAIYGRFAEEYLDAMVRHVRKEPNLAEAMVEGLLHAVDLTLSNPVLSPLFGPDSESQLTTLGPTSRVLNTLVRQAWGPLLLDAQEQGHARTDLSLDVFTEFMLRMVFSLLSAPPTNRSRDEAKDFLRQVVTPFVTAGVTSSPPTPPESAPVLAARRPSEAANQDTDGPVADRLLEYAAALFREQGYAASSTRQLAERLGISQPSLYYHAGSKQEILERVSSEGLKRLQHAVQTSARSRRTAVVPKLVRAYLAALIHDKDMHLVRVIDHDALDEEAAVRIVEAHTALLDAIDTVFADEQEAGRIQSRLKPRQLTLVLTNLLNWSIFWLDPEDERELSKTTKLLTEALLDGIARAPLHD